MRLLQRLYPMPPVYAANMAAPFAGRWPAAARTISERWQASHKTWLGYAPAVAASTLTAWLQSRLRRGGGLVDHEGWPPLVVNRVAHALGLKDTPW